MTMLPPAFAELEPFAPTWCLATEPERWAQRHSSTMAELQEFYDAAVPHLEDAVRALKANGFAVVREGRTPEDGPKAWAMVKSP